MIHLFKANNDTGHILKKGLNVATDSLNIKYVYGKPEKTLNPYTFLNSEPYIAENSKMLTFRYSKYLKKFIYSKLSLRFGMLD